METKKYKFGNVFNTEAVVEDITSEKENKVLFFEQETEDGKLLFTYRMGKNDVVYGLGEQTRGINKRGYVYESFCSDDPSHTEEKSSLYGAHNMILVDGREKGERFIAFFDTPDRVKFDIGYTDIDILTVTTEKDVDVYLIDGRGEGLEDIVKEFRRIIGQSYVAPKWAFGFQQCRWSYGTADEVREVAKNYRENNIPIDAIYLDIDYMDHYKDFTINNEAFPEFESFVKEMKEDNIRLVPIIDAGVKIEEGYDIYEEGVKNDYFCKDKEGKDFVGAVWPGKVHFPDFLKEDTRKWFGSKYDKLIDMGIEGFWNDMNEPAIFYSEDGLREAIDYAYSLKDKNVDIGTFFSLKDKMLGVANSMSDYSAFYHDTKEGKISHIKLHNLYGYNMTRAASENFEENYKDKRILMFSRASYIGAHRYGGIWQGDNMSWWSHILLSIKMLPSLNMCGFLYTGSDLGGFGAHATEDLVMRWTQFAIYNPLMRNHAAAGTRSQEFYRFKDIEGFKNMVEIRYGLIPYLYSEYMKAVLNGTMYAKPLSFVYEDDEYAIQTEDQLIIGNELMIAPVYTQNATGRYVYLPEKMLKIKMRSLDDYETEELEKGHYYIECNLNEVVFFVRNNHLIPVCKSAECVEKLDETDFTVFGITDGEASYELYTDDGNTKNYEEDAIYITINMVNGD